jgi:hypothetical protein
MAKDPLDPLGRHKQLLSIRKKMEEKLGHGAVFGSLTPQQELMLQRASEFAEFKRVEHERQCEAIKAALSPYIFDEKVAVRSQHIDDITGETRVIELSHFDAMLKCITLYLNVINLQNKMWWLYNIPHKQELGDASSTVNIRSVQILAAAEELQRMAKQNPANELKPQLTDDRGSDEIKRAI